MRRLIFLRLILALALTLALAGCAAAVTPRRAFQAALAQPEVARWFAAHSAPSVLAGMDGGDVKRFVRYHPAATIDLVKEGLAVRLDADFGPEPRHLDLLVDRGSGAVLKAPDLGR
ncbi:MAG TPA: hypothetical protein VGK74_11510 [Symbiobacteriaceae bacterium]|jgi:hypothetical protein